MRAALLAALIHLSTPAAALELKVIAHVHSSTSHGGELSLEEISRKASGMGIDAVLFSDSALVRVEYGIWPLRRLFRVSQERSSVLQRTPESYLAELNDLRAHVRPLIIIAGAEVAPYYRWSGSPFSGLILHDWSRHLIVVGLEEASSFRDLPILGNGGSWDPYASATPWEPYRALVRYAREKGALTFWAHPAADDSTTALKLDKRVSTRTEPYPEALEHVPETTGFGVLSTGYGMAKPGRQWDAALDAYCAGTRSRPPWAFAELDFRGSGHVKLDTAFMVVDAAARTEAAVLEALGHGRFYSVGRGYAVGFQLRVWELRAEQAVARAGEELSVSGAVSVAARVEGVSAGAQRATVTLLRNGAVVKREEMNLPAAISWNDPTPGRCSHYRILVEDKDEAVLLSNPIFARTR